MTILQKFRDLITPPEVLAPADIAQLLFGQQNVGTQDFFEALHGQAHTIPLTEFPHYRFLAEPSNHAPSIYERYLSASWNGRYGSDRNTEERRQAKIREFLGLCEEIQTRARHRTHAIRKPLTLCTRPDGKRVIVHGNHRASIALKLGLEIRASTMRLHEHLKRVVSVADEFYGTGRLGMPYQTICFQGEPLLRGRRQDVYERLRTIPRSDIEGKTVLDLGCNLGMSCYTATEMGAVKAVGVEFSRKIVNAAVQLNSLFARPCHFILHDLNEPLHLSEQFDTVFCFSVVKHLQRHEAIVDLIRTATKRVLIFECHARTTAADYDYLLNSSFFSRIELLGHTADGVHSKNRTRALYRCEVRKN